MPLSISGVGVRSESLVISVRHCLRRPDQCDRKHDEAQGGAADLPTLLLHHLLIVC